MVKKLFIILCLAAGFYASANASERIEVSKNHRFLTSKGGLPFFYLADTAWELFHRLNREEATNYLQDRAKKGFTVIQAVAIAELDGINVGNAYGHLPFFEQKNISILDYIS